MEDTRACCGDRGIEALPSTYILLSKVRPRELQIFASYLGVPTEDTISFLTYLDLPKICS